MAMKVDRAIAPNINGFQSFRLKTPEGVLLSNGIEVKVFENRQLELIHFTLKIEAGSLFEEEKYVANACYSLLKESAKGYSANEIDAFLDYYGVSFDIHTSLQFITINFIIPYSNCETVLPFISNLLTNPDFTEENLNLLKSRRIKDLEYNSMKVGFRASQLMFRTLFGEDTLQGKVLQKNDIESVSLSQIRDYYQKTFCAGNIRLFVAGKVDDSIKKMMAIAFEVIKKGAKTTAPALFSQKPAAPFVLENRENSLQSSFILCKRFISYSDENRRDFAVLATLFGGYFGSRLMQNLREKNGYTYGVNNGVLYFRNTGIYYIESDVNVDKTKEAVEACFDEMRRIKSELVGTDELEIVKNYMMGGMLRDVDGSVSYMKKYIYWHDFGLDEKEFDTLMSSIGKIEADRVYDLANKYFIEKDFSKIIVGNYDN